FELAKLVEWNTQRGVMHYEHGVGTQRSEESQDHGLLLQKLQCLSIAMLKTATRAKAVWSPNNEVASTEVAGGFLAFRGRDVALTRAIGVGTEGPVNEDE